MYHNVILVCNEIARDLISLNPTEGGKFLGS